MPDGSLRPPGPPPTSTSHITTIDTSSSSSLRTFPLAARKVRPKTAVDESMKAKIFGSAPASPTTARPRTGHQSVRGRISGPIPIPNPLEDDEFPIRNPGTAIASSTPLDSDMRPPPTVPPALPSPVAVSFAAAPPPPPPPVSQMLSEDALMDMVDVPQIPQTVPEHPGTPANPPGSATGLSDPSPESAASNVSGPRSSAKLHRTNPSSSARYSMISATSETGGSTDSPDGHPQRKRSTLRSAIGRLLRRKKKEGSLSSVNESEREIALGGRQQKQQAQQQQQQQQQHRSVSSHLARSRPLWLCDIRLIIV